MSQTDTQLEAPEAKRARYLTFTFFEKLYGMELEVLGWTQLRPRADKPRYVKGFVNPWGSQIPVIDLAVLYGTGPTEMTRRACIVIFQHCDCDDGRFGVAVEDVSMVVNMKDGTTNEFSPLLVSAKRHFSLSPAVKN